jgi:4-hydroxy-3-methylbut-2-enyl diphosphate reductase
MKILLARTAGFCFGVRRAVNIAFRASGKKHKGVYTLGPIIHNPQVVEQLKEKGIIPINDIKGKKDIRALIIRTHGIPRNLSEEISSIASGGKRTTELRK